MTSRYSISTNGGNTWTEVSPVNGSALGLEDSRDLDKGQVFFRRHLKGSPKLKGDDYLLLYPLERAPHRRCEEVLLKLETKCGAGWREAWRGRFSAGSCAWDLDRCEVEINPETVDAYTCLLDGMRVKRNILSVLPVDASALNLPNLEFFVCTTVGFIQSPPGNCDEIGGPGWSPGDPYINEWEPAVSVADPLGAQLNVFWRERVEVECAGTPEPPPGAGWAILENNCATNGTAVYVRTPTISWPFGTPTQGAVIDGEAVPPAGDCQWLLLGIGGVDDPFSPGTDERVSLWICPSDASGTAINRSRLLEDVAEYLVEQTGCGLEGVRSDFFEWLPPGDAPGYVAGQNYVTGTPNQHASLLIAQKSDIITPAASNPATIGEMSLEEFLVMLSVTHQVFWRIDEAGYLRLEHWSYWTSQPGLDLTTDADVVERLRYEHLSETIPRIERARWMEAQGRDFVGKDIVYSGPCVRVVDDEGVEEYSPGRITTDVAFVLNDPTAIAKDGFVLMASVYDGSVYNVVVDTGAITGNLLTNAPMSWANLQRDFWTFNRFLPSGEMNGAQVVFDGYMPNIEQKDVSVPVCCGLYELDASDYLTTNLGVRIGVAQAFVESAAHDLTTGRTTFALRYAY